MKLRSLCCVPALLLACVPLAPANGQTYKNIVNSRFNAVSNGPMQALIVDVPGAADRVAIDRAVADRVNFARKARSRGLGRQLAMLRRTLGWKGELTPGIPEIVIERHQGRLAAPAIKTRNHGTNDLTFTLPLSAAAGDGGWTQQQRDELGNIINIVYPALRSVYGAPLWNGTVAIKNGDNMPSIISDPNALSGGIYNISKQEITFAQYNSIQSKVLNLTQMMALAFHGPASISFDAWERGMARAATIETVRSAQGALEAAFGSGIVNIDDPLWSALDRYEWLNQPPLGNDRFYPVSKANGEANTPSFPNMLIPRLIMAGSVWLKVAAETPSFFSEFNERYLQAFLADPSIKNNVPALKNLAQQSVTAGKVEGVAFTEWYNRQYVMDTSVSPGTKLYALSSPLRPSASEDDYSIGIVVYYYETTFDASSNSDERNLNGTSFPIYTDFSSGNRLFLAAQYERIDIRDGLGTVAPTFFNTIGGDASLNGMMRVSIDIPVGDEDLRIYAAPRNMGKDATPSNFWGVVVGADTGKIRLQTENGVNQEFEVAQGAFGGVAVLNGSDPFIRPQRATLTFTNAAGAEVLTKQVSIAFREYVGVLYAADPVAALEHTFPAGPAMVAFPIRPLMPKAAEALLDPTSGNPIFSESTLLMARWQQSLNRADGDNYQRYPMLDPIAPGKGYWQNFSAPTPVRVQGKTTTLDPHVSVGLLHGWNQIGNPYDTPIELPSLQFQYLADNVPVDLATAIGKGWIVAQNVPTVGTVAIWDFSLATGYVPAAKLEPWKGYWIRVLVSEGVTVTYSNPASRAARVSRRAASLPPPARGWAVPITVRSNDGYGASAWLGQSEEATSGYNARLDAQRPPVFSNSVPAIYFDQRGWGLNSGRYYSDIRRMNSRDSWEVTVSTPNPNSSYTLSWANLTSIPRTTRLILVDVSTGSRRYMQTASGYTFSSGTTAIRKFRIEPELRTRGALQVMNLVLRTSRSVGASTVEIAYDLNQSASVTTEVRGADGRLVRRLVSGRAAAVGTSTVIWDAKDDHAVSVASGTYVVQIVARTPEGDLAKSIRPVTLVR